MSVAQPLEPDGDPPVLRMPSPDTNTAAGEMLGEELRRHRELRGLTLKDVAPVIRGSTSKVSRLERGESPPKPRDVYDLARHYRLSDAEMRVVEQLLAQTNNQEWYEQFADVTPDYLRRLIRLEGRADWITIFENQVVPGLLQTRAYAESMVRLVRPDAPDDDVMRIVMLRLRRQFILEQGRRLTLLLDETVLDRCRGGAKVMHEQMEHLVKAAQSHKVNIRLLNKNHVLSPYPFTLLKFPTGGPSELAYVEHVNSATYATQRKALDGYHKWLALMHAAAESMESSLEKLQAAVERYAQQARVDS
ncbi:helix-turn-helix transcriptional regulator [Streptomyces sp. 769]|uniref:helix-turn-helix domain-containing protein n=1 Tax=Streptomyces sp. 769 TaxID=1262452 RepID=UPI00057E72CE|nr:helix-turn-helix transcriptional regulator [Streptomyces sp. 769]